MDIERAEGVTVAERATNRLAERAFLRLWNFPSVYRDQGSQGIARDGKEVCDLLVVSGNDIIIFSDKDCKFPDSGTDATRWGRWYKRAVQKSAEQVWGAERWIREHPDRLFLDRKCQRPFPFQLPLAASAKFHRVVVAHGAAARCRAAFGGSGTLLVMPAVVGAMHYEGSDVLPFALGQVDTDRGFVHVFDDLALDFVLDTLDTITDFVRYLGKRENLITSLRLVGAAGEEDLLAYYLRSINDEGEHDFLIPDGATQIVVSPGAWGRFDTGPERRSQVAADRVSYNWDRMVERFVGHILAGTGVKHPSATLDDQEQAVRLMARESRFRRRMLAEALIGLIEKTPASQPLFRANRVVPPSRPGEPYYVILLLSGPVDVPLEHHQIARRKVLEMLCMVVKLRFPNATDIVGYAKNPGPSLAAGEDVVRFDARHWSDEDRASAEEYSREWGLLTSTTISSTRHHEYPLNRQQAKRLKTKASRPRPVGSFRNSPCPCGSGLKRKRCCRGPSLG